MNAKLTPEYLTKAYVKDLRAVDDIAAECGCSVPNIRKRLKDWKITRGKAAIIGKPAWNAGLTKDCDPRVAQMSEGKKGENNPMFGVEAWNTGLTKETDARVQGVADKLTGRIHSEETREKMTAAKLGLRGPETNHYSGGETTRNSYLSTLVGNDGVPNYEYSHRLVAEKALGRKLAGEEHVHHADCDKLNNSPENLIVLTNSGHLSLHAAMRKLGYMSYPAQLSWLAKNGHWFEVLV